MFVHDRLILNTRAFQMTDVEFYRFCRDNADLKIERDSNFNIVIMSPTKKKTGYYNTEIIYQLALWNKQNHSGTVFDSSTAFQLKNGAIRSPDAAWISAERYNPQTDSGESEEFEEDFPDFVIELKSKNDSVKNLMNKMTEYMENGVRLGYLILPEQQKVLIYRSDHDMVTKLFSEKIIADQVVAGFEMDLSFMKT